MSKELEVLKRIRQETCPATYMPDFNKNECCDTIEKALKEKQYLDHFLNTIFDTYDDIEIVGEYDEDLRKYCITIKFNGSELSFYCNHDEYLYWRKLSGVDDMYGPEDLQNGKRNINEPLVYMRLCYVGCDAKNEC